MNTAGGGLVVPGTIGVRIAAEVRRYGAVDVETGGFMLAPAPEPMRVSIVALAGERGVTRRWGLFRVSGRAIDRLFAWADDQGMRIRVLRHHRADEVLNVETVAPVCGGQKGPELMGVKLCRGSTGRPNGVGLVGL